MTIDRFVLAAAASIVVYVLLKLGLLALFILAQIIIHYGSV